MTTYPTEISVLTPVSQAIDRVKLMLFQPFDLGRWFVIGFCAWLASLGESGGFPSNFGPHGGGQSGNGPNFRELMDETSNFVAHNLYWIIPAVLILLVLAVAWGLLLTWLSSRGKFMFLHCVALNQAEVKRPWREFTSEGNSLFWFRFVLGLFATLLLLPLLAAILFIAARMLYRGHADGGGVVLAIGFGLILIALAVCFGLIRKFTIDFVVPIMFLRRTNCTTAWNEFLGLLGENIGRFTLYVLFQIVLRIAIVMLIVAAILMTCCIAGCLIALPYIGTVALLPVPVFKRSYSIYYLAQYGPTYNCVTAG
jgi:hypothetical protein